MAPWKPSIAVMLKTHWTRGIPVTTSCTIGGAYLPRARWYMAFVALVLLCLGLLLSGYRLEQPIVPLRADGLVSDFWSTSGRLHVVTTRHHWIWNGATWIQQADLIAHQQSIRALRLPTNAVVELVHGRLILKSADGSEAVSEATELPWTDVAFRMPSTLFSAQRAYYPYPIDIFTLAADGSLWLRSINADHVLGTLKLVGRLPAGATPLRLALHERQLVVLFQQNKVLQVGRLGAGGIEYQASLHQRRVATL